ACRYCGLLHASFAADQRARRLDSKIRTSLTHTCFMAGEYLRAAMESERDWQTGNLGALALLSAGDPDAMARVAQEAARYRDAEVFQALLAGNGSQVRAAVDRTLATFPDPEFHFYAGLICAYVREYDRAIEILASTVQRGFFPLQTLLQHEWLAPVRERPDFQ